MGKDEGSDVGDLPMHLVSAAANHSISWRLDFHLG